MEKMRLDKYVSTYGGMTRKEARAAVRSGRVRVDNCPIRQEGEKVSANQEICLDGELLRGEKYRYVMLYKPVGVISATRDGREKTVMDFLDCGKRAMFPVGRLDKDAEGLMLLTDNGALAHRILSPRFHIAKKYQVWYEGALVEDAPELVQAGIDIGAKKKTAPGVLEILEPGQIFLTISEGKFHQVKRMIGKLGGRVTRLKRISMAGLVLDTALKPGEYRELTTGEVAALMKGAEREEAWQEKNITQ